MNCEVPFMPGNLRADGTCMFFFDGNCAFDGQVCLNSIYSEGEDENDL